MMKPSDHKEAAGRGYERRPDDRWSPPKATRPGEDGCFVPQYHIDTVFIFSVTAAERVYGVRKRYKCLGCLRYHNSSCSLLVHIDQGWREGFSCKAFYRRLKSMSDREPTTSSASQDGTEPCQGLLSQLSITSPVPTATPEEFCLPAKSNTDMIHEWLLKNEAPMVL